MLTQSCPRAEKTKQSHDATIQNIINQKASSQLATLGSGADSAVSQSKSSVKGRGHWYDRLHFRNKLHRTRSQHTLETCGRDMSDMDAIAEKKSRSDDDLRHRDVVSVNLCDQKYGDIMLDLCRDTMYDNSNKVERWLAGLRASLPLEDVVGFGDDPIITATHKPNRLELFIDITNDCKSPKDKRSHSKKSSSTSLLTTPAKSTPSKKSSSHRKTKTRVDALKSGTGSCSSPSLSKDSNGERLLDSDCNNSEIIREVEESLKERLNIVFTDKKMHKRQQRKQKSLMSRQSNLCGTVCGS